jgi:hypothetical protein
LIVHHFTDVVDVTATAAAATATITTVFLPITFVSRSASVRFDCNAVPIADVVVLVVVAHGDYGCGSRQHVLAYTAALIAGMVKAGSRRGRSQVYVRSVHADAVITDAAIGRRYLLLQRRLDVLLRSRLRSERGTVLQKRGDTVRAVLALLAVTTVIVITIVAAVAMETINVATARTNQVGRGCTSSRY